MTESFEVISRLVLEKHKAEIQEHLKEKKLHKFDDSEVEVSSATSEDEGIVQDLDLPPVKTDNSTADSTTECCTIL